MGKSNSETFAAKSTLIIIEFESLSFSAKIRLNETNYDIWCQIIEIHITIKKKL